MDKKYKIKNNNSDIKYKVNFSTVGNANTVPWLVDATGQATNLKPSPPSKNGSIPKRTLAKANELKDCQLKFLSAILLDGLPPDSFDMHFQNLQVEYILEGGIDGEISFTLDADDKKLDKEAKLITVLKKISFING